MSTPSSFWRSSQKLFSKNVLELQTIRTTSRNVKNGKILLNNYQRHAGPGHRILQTYAVHMKTITWRKYWKYLLAQNIKNIWSNYVPQNVKNGIEKYLIKMETHPYTMNVINATILGFAGDIICQKAAEKKENIDWNRTARFAFFCGYYQGVICTGVYRYYTKFPMLKKDPTKQALVDNFTHVPLAYMPAFYLTDGFLQGKSAKQIYEEKFKTGEYTKMTLVCMVVWVPFQMWNFHMIPLEFRCLTVQGAALFWNIALSYWNSGPDQYSSVI